MSRYYALINDKREIKATSIYDGLVTSPYWVNLVEADYEKICSFLYDKKTGVTISTDGTITTYILPEPPKPPLKDLAQSALSDVQSQAPMIVAMGESFGPQTQAYVKALQSIINDTDTTSTELPAKPDKLTD